MKSQIFKILGDENVKLTTYISRGITENKKPAIIICPGGAYISTTDREGECVALKFMSEGYQAFVLDYSTEYSNPNKVKFPQQLLELEEAIRLIREHADEWQIDKDKINLIGFSAGGHLIATYGNYWNTNVFSNSIDKEEVKPNALILSYPLLDYVQSEKRRKQSSEKSIDMGHVIGKSGKKTKVSEMLVRVNKSIFGTENPDESVLLKYSPVYHVNDHTPPTFIWGTQNDEILNFKQSLDYASNLSDKGIPCEIHMYQNGVHGLSLANRESAVYDYQINPSVSTWFYLAIKWLDNIND